MTSGIFLVQDGGKSVRMDESDYDSEDLLQSLLEDYPDLLAGDQMEVADPRRWLLARREMGVPGEEDGGDRWSVDHLFLDPDAISTSVEVKRSSDTRIRREVVGQMLDYAANAVACWPVEHLRSRFEQQCESKGRDANEVLSEFLGDDAGVEAYWQKAKTNLQAGKIRIVFVADVIPNELKRIVEFLNEQMDPAQVLAVEIKQYIGEGLRSLVPRVIGQTAEAEKRKGGAGQQRKWDEPSFFMEFEKRNGAELAQIAKKLYDWARTKTDRCYWGQGVRNGSVYPILDDERGKQRLFIVCTNGQLEIPFDSMRSATPFSDQAKRIELMRRRNEVEEVELSEDAVDRWPKVRVSSLAPKQACDKFIAAMEWAVDQISATPRQ